MSTSAKSGLFFLPLESTGLQGAPRVHLTLGVYTPKSTVTGFAHVTQAVNPPLDLRSHVTGNLIYETVMGPGSKVRIDLTGWPEIVWPKDAGIGPVIPDNFRAMLILEPDFTHGVITYSYRTDFSGAWHTIHQQIKVAA